MSNLPVPGAGYTWAPGGIPTAAQLNTNLRDYLTFLVNPPLFAAAGLASTSLPGSVYTALTLAGATSMTDTYGGYNSGNPTRYTAQAAGWYSLKAVLAHGSASTVGFRAAAFFVNGTQLADVQESVSAGSANGTILVITADYFLNVGDYVELRGYQSSGGALATQAGASRLSARWVHA